jgi:hypothetical protein
MGRNAKNTELEIRQTILRLAAELGLNPTQIAVLTILAALGGGTFSRIKRIRDSMDEYDQRTPDPQDDHPDGDSSDNQGDPLEEVTANLKRRVETVRAKQLSSAFKREVQQMMRSETFKNRILSEARERATELVERIFAAAPAAGKVSDARARSVAPPIVTEMSPADVECPDPNCADDLSDDAIVRLEEAPVDRTAPNRDVESTVAATATGQRAALPARPKTQPNLSPRNKALGSTAICTSLDRQLLKENALGASATSPDKGYLAPRCPTMRANVTSGG